MKKLFLLLLLLSAPGWAQNWQLDVRIYRVQPGHPELEKVRFLGDHEPAQQAGLELLDSGTVTGVLNEDGMMMAGRKVPIPYQDPRVGGYQVQYVDSGLTVDAKVMDKRTTDGRWVIECRTKRFNPVLENATSNLPGQDGFTCQSTTLLRPGQWAIVAVSKGVFGPQYLKRAYANAFGENDTLLIAIGVRKP